MDSGTIQEITLQDLNPLHEAFDEDDDEHGNPVQGVQQSINLQSSYRD